MPPTTPACASCRTASTLGAWPIGSTSGWGAAPFARRTGHSSRAARCSSSPPRTPKAGRTARTRAATRASCAWSDLTCSSSRATTATASSAASATCLPIRRRAAVHRLRIAATAARQRPGDTARRFRGAGAPPRRAARRARARRTHLPQLPALHPPRRRRRTLGRRAAARPHPAGRGLEIDAHRGRRAAGAGGCFYPGGACSGGAAVSRRTPLISAPKISVVALMYRNTSVATTPAKLP